MHSRTPFFTFYSKSYFYFTHQIFTYLGRRSAFKVVFLSLSKIFSLFETIPFQFTGLPF